MHWLLLFVRIFVYTEEICLSLYKFKDKEGGGGGEEEEDDDDDDEVLNAIGFV